MSKHGNNEMRVLAIDPTSHGFGFVVLEGPRRLVDWGLAPVGGVDNSRCLARITNLTEHYRPAVLVLEDPEHRLCRRCPRVRRLLVRAERLATARGLRVKRISRHQVRTTFAPLRARTKEHVAAVLASRFPELRLRLPPQRRLWMSEDPRMSIFDAASFALTYFHYRNKRRRSP